MSGLENALGSIKERVERIYGLLEDVEHELGASGESVRRGETEVARAHARSAYHILMHAAGRLRDIAEQLSEAFNLAGD